ncbi:GNAT family N-acetyltransferase [Microbaculum marinum]|uniref:GNAT family N-acetyltransferase n=1 Tax=Microbaculum marinum TaxID=1764581 RepID=A0AAW9RWY7_9HYPH
MTDTVRPAVAADVERLVDIETAVFVPPDYEPMSRRQFAYHVDNPRAVLLVYDSDGSVHGYALGLMRTTSRYLRFYSLAVAPGLQGGSVGRRLFEAIEQAARERGLGVITEVRADNERLHRRYLALGYSEFQRKPEYYPDGCTAIRMRKSR